MGSRGTLPEIVGQLQRRALNVGMYVNVHKSWQPNRPTSFTVSGEPCDMYMMPKRHHISDHEPSLLAWATADDIEAAISEIERRTFKQKAG